jgi:hypothetical protein
MKHAYTLYQSRIQGGREEMLTTGEVQALGRASHTAIYKWCRSGKLHPICVGNPIGRHGGRMRLFRKSDVVRFLAAREEKRRRKSRGKKK